MSPHEKGRTSSLDGLSNFAQSKAWLKALREAWLDYKAENYPDEKESEVLIPLAAAFEAGWIEGSNHVCNLLEKTPRNKK